MRTFSNHFDLGWPRNKAASEVWILVACVPAAKKGKEGEGAGIQARIRSAR